MAKDTTRRLEGRASAEAELKPTNRRVESFSDAVFAIALTISVLEIQIPDGLAFGSDSAQLQHFAAQIATYAVSFVVITILWGSHHFLIFTLPSADRAVVWLNNHVLFWVTLIPVVARFLGAHPTAPRAAASYAFVIMMCTFSFTMLRRHASRVSHNDFHRALHRQVFRKAWFAIALYAAAIPLAFVNIKLTWTLLVMLPMLFFLPVVRRSMEWHLFSQRADPRPSNAQ